jgi:hypothetical protein
MSIPTFREVRLDIVRPGPPHNQLLSPLTPYIALCGEGSPITFHIDYEHQELLNRLEQLRYFTKQGQKFTLIPTRVRESQVGELGRDIARILSRIETLSTELARAQCSPGPGGSQSMVHLRIVLSGSELSLLPFELAIAPLAYPGEGLELNLQASLPITVTREIRRGGQVSMPWRQNPKVLVLYAEPEGLQVPAQAHIQAIRTSLEPWIRRLKEQEKSGNDRTDAENRLHLVQRRMRVLPNASIESIYELCSKERFTHVHILAHGDTYEHAGNTRFGVALCRKGSPQSKEVVSGKRLVKALQAEGAHGDKRCEPLVVTLATCDSGNQTTVMVPGGSIAHDLHVEGIPLVFASQFPLTVPGSVRMAEHLYPRLFRGDDPRQILFELRRQLYQESQTDHDWASLIAYAALPRDFGNQVAAFSSRQIREAIKVLLDHADSTVNLRAKTTAEAGERKEEAKEGGPEKQKKGEEQEKIEEDLLSDKEPRLKAIIDEIEHWLWMWRARLPDGDSAEERVRRSEMLGMHGSTYKRIALLLAKTYRAMARRYYNKSREYYRQTMEEVAATNMHYYWSGTQFLALQAILGEGEPLKELHALLRGLAARDTNIKGDDSTKAWAHATMAELELLGTFHSLTSDPPSDAEVNRIIESVKDHCATVVKIMGPKSFHVGSTYRQFKRYHDAWSNRRWQAIAESAMQVLNPGNGDLETDYPEDY